MQLSEILPRNPMRAVTDKRKEGQPGREAQDVAMESNLPSHSFDEEISRNHRKTRNCRNRPTAWRKEL